ncbi:MAG: hypothetical protein E7314_03790 [Clostridiales bacterium]|nr:hypothetical protein [Clostridiales bacterium]
MKRITRIFYFSNEEELIRLAKEGKKEEFKKALEATDISCYNEYQNKVEAGIAFFKILNAARKGLDVEMVEALSKKSFVLFAENWIAIPLVKAKEDKKLCAYFDEKALKVIAEYEEYKAEAVRAWNNHNGTEWEEAYNELVTFRRYKDELSFFRDGEKYIIYHHDDKDYTEN